MIPERTLVIRQDVDAGQPQRRQRRADEKQVRRQVVRQERRRIHPLAGTPDNGFRVGEPRVGLLEQEGQPAAVTQVAIVREVGVNPATMKNAHGGDEQAHRNPLRGAEASRGGLWLPVRDAPKLGAGCNRLPGHLKETAYATAPQSPRSASVGATRAARIAGTATAVIATAAMTAADAASAPASNDVTPNSSPRSTRSAAASGECRARSRRPTSVRRRPRPAGSFQLAMRRSRAGPQSHASDPTRPA